MKPEERRWYLAEIILEHTIQDDPRNVVHINIHLVQADSKEQAYDKSLGLGRQSEMEYANTDGKQVRVVFRGLRELTVIEDPLEDGAELIFEQRIAMPEDQLGRWIKAKNQLNIFSASEPDPNAPNYMPKEVWGALLQVLAAEAINEKDCRP